VQESGCCFGPFVDFICSAGVAFGKVAVGVLVVGDVTFAQSFGTYSVLFSTTATMAYCRHSNLAFVLHRDVVGKRIV
jgi:hypothetical protein